MTVNVASPDLSERVARVHALVLDGMTIDEVNIREARDQNEMPDVALAKTPEVCRVRFTLKPTAESHIGVELWMPTNEWNDSLLGTGNGGQAGEINQIALISGASLGFAVANTDMGTTADPLAMVGSIERIRDFGGRATHLMTVFSKRIVAAFYGRDAERSYFMGVSTGGQQALREAQDYPNDYDGIIALCPAHNRIRLHTSFVSNWRALTDKSAVVISREQAAAVVARLVEVYGQASGSAPGDAFLSYPDQIDIDWSVLDDVLEPLQAAALRTIAEGTVDPVTGERIFGAYSLGMALGDWYTTLEGREALRGLNFPFVWLWGAEFDPESFDMHADALYARERLSELLDARNPDLGAFRGRGGKLILVTGTADDIIPFYDTIEYYEQIVDAAESEEAIAEFCRFFVVPGLGHGLGGPGMQDVGYVAFSSVDANTEHNVLLAMKNWVEQGRAPERILPVRFKDGVLGAEVVAERPVFPYPLRTRYVSGDPCRADSYEATHS